MTAFALVVWLGLSAWGAAVAWRCRPQPRLLSVQRRRSPPVNSPRLRWLRDWGGWIIAGSVGSLAPALAPNTPLWLQASLMLMASAGLLRLVYALDTPPLGHGVVAGLGLIALLLDSFSGGAWARYGALGHGSDTPGMGELYGAFALLWALLACRAWLSIEGNPIGVAYLMGAIALWLGWKGLSPALGWGATLTALTLSLLIIQRELAERRRVRIAMQNQPIRTVRVARGYDLAWHGGILLGLCALALGLSGAPSVQFGGLSPQEGWYLAIGVVCGVGLWRLRTVRPLSPALQRAWLVGVVSTALLSAQPLGVLALGMLLYWGLVGTILQETTAPTSNPDFRTGGNNE